MNLWVGTRRCAWLLGVITAFVIGGLTYACFNAGFLNHRLTLRTYFSDAQGLRAGSPVSLAGVEIGKVTTVRVLSQSGKNIAEITFLISTPYDLKIPNNAAITTASAGILGDTFLVIKTDGASGPPATNGTVLKAVPPERDFTTEFSQSFVNAVRENQQQDQTSVVKPAASIQPANPKQ
ncbi:MAG: MCE family protein [Terracidiphilus sp.]